MCQYSSVPPSPFLVCQTSCSLARAIPFPVIIVQLGRSIVTPLVQHIEINAKVTVGRASDAWQRARCTRTGQPGNIWLPTDVLTVNRPSRRKPATKCTIFRTGLGLWGLQKYFVGPEATVTITLSEPSKSGKASSCLTNMGNN